MSRPVTLDLNGAVAIRGRSAADAAVSELVLTNSVRNGAELCLNTNRRYLARAVELGFRELQFVDNEAPIVCRDERRIYLWAPIDREGVIPPADNALRSCSPQTTASQTPQRVNRIARRLRPRTPTTSKASATRRHQAVKAGESADVIARTLELRTLVQGLGDLVRQIRHQRQQTKLMRSTLAQLRQLKTLEV